MLCGQLFLLLPTNARRDKIKIKQIPWGNLFCHGGSQVVVGQQLTTPCLGPLRRHHVVIFAICVKDSSGIFIHSHSRIGAVIKILDILIR